MVIAFIGVALLFFSLTHESTVLIEDEVCENPQRLFGLGEVPGDDVFFLELFVEEVHGMFGCAVKGILFFDLFLKNVSALNVFEKSRRNMFSEFFDLFEDIRLV